MEGGLSVSSFFISFTVGTRASAAVEVTTTADEETGGDLIVLIDGSVQEGLLAARRARAPAGYITAVADLW